MNYDDDPYIKALQRLSDTIEQILFQTPSDDDVLNADIVIEDILDADVIF